MLILNLLHCLVFMYFIFMLLSSKDIKDIIRSGFYLISISILYLTITLSNCVDITVNF